jgi:membrane protein
LRRHWGRLFAETVRDFFGLNGTFLSAGLAFYVLLYCFPLLLLLVTALGYVLEESDRAMSGVESLVSRLFPASEDAVLGALESFAAHRGLLGIVTVFAFLLFGTFLFGAVRHVLNVVFEVEQRRTFLRGFGADVVAMLGTGGLLAVAGGITSALALAIEIASRLPVLHGWIEPGWVVLGHVLTFTFAATLLYLLFRIAPAKTLSRPSLVTASITGAVLFEISKWLFAWYVSRAHGFAAFYGALGGLVFFVIWIYYASVVFVLAATLGRVAERWRTDTETTW